MGRWNIAAAGLILITLPEHALSAQPGTLPNSNRVCKASFSDGTLYEIWDRVLLKEWEGQTLYVKVRAYYRPASGELLFRTTAYSKTGYINMLRENSKTPGSQCREAYRHILLLEDGEWADFWAERGRIVIFHSDLKFSKREAAWHHIDDHWRDAADDPSPSTKWGTEINLYDRLGRDFFRPKALEFDARPYTYDSLVKVKKVGAVWEVVLKGADEPNRATVLLDKSFNVISATKNPQNH